MSETVCVEMEEEDIEALQRELLSVREEVPTIEGFVRQLIEGYEIGEE